MTRSSLWNLAGFGLPLLVAIFTIPTVVHGLGIERFGALTLVWAFLGYFALFDLGLGRAVIRLVARQLAPQIPDQNTDSRSLIGSALAVSVALGMVGMLIMLAAGHAALATNLLRASEEVQRELRASLTIVAALLPIVTATSVLIGVLEGHQQFRAVNLIRIPAGVLNYLLPVAALQFSDELSVVVAATGALRVAVAGAYLAACRRFAGMGPILSKPSLVWLRPLLSFGGWLTVSNIVGPLMVYLDRFVLAAAMSLSVTAYYTTPFEIVTKLWIIPSALAATLFPAFAVATGGGARSATSLFVRGSELMFYAMVPAVVIVMAFAREGLRLWLGEDFAKESTLVAQVLALGMLMNAMAFVPMVLIQGAGRADITAKLHIVELPLYLAVLWVLVAWYGIVGAAVAWCLRVSADCVAHFWLSGHFLEREREALRSFLLTCVGVATTLPSALLDDVMVRAVSTTVVITTISIIAWIRLRARATPLHRKPRSAS